MVANVTYMHVLDGMHEWEMSLCNVVIPVRNLSFLKPQFPELIIPVVSYSNVWPLCMLCCNWSMLNLTSCGHFYNASDYKGKHRAMTSATLPSIHESTSISHLSFYLAFKEAVHLELSQIYLHNDFNSTHCFREALQKIMTLIFIILISHALFSRSFRLICIIMSVKQESFLNTYFAIFQFEIVISMLVTSKKINVMQKKEKKRKFIS